MSSRRYVPGMGKANAEIAIVGQSVGPHELRTGKPFSGPAGDLLDEALRAAGLRREDCWITNVLKYQPATENLKIQKWEDFESVEALWQELEQVNPQKIVALGNIPLYFLTGKTGINNYRGSVLRSQRLNKLVVPTYNPAHLLYGGEVSGYWQKFLIHFDIKKAKNLPLTWKPPHRVLWIVKNSAELYRFIERNADNEIVSVDIETFGCIPICVGLAFSKTEGVSVPLYSSINGIRICTIPEQDINEIWRLLDNLFRTKKIIGQNFKFDQERLEQGLGFKIEHFYADTMLMAHVLNPELPKSIAFLASIHTEEPFWKDEGREFNPKRDRIDQLLLYNAKDVAVTKEIFDVQLKDLEDEGLKEYYFGYYHRLHDFYYRMELAGLRVDEDRRKDLIERYKAKLKEVYDELEEILHFVPNVNSTKDVALVVYEHLGLPKRESLDEDSLISLANNVAKDPLDKKVLHLIIEGRRLRKILGPDKLGFALDYDGRARTSYRIAGTETGRSSTSVLKPPVRPMKVGLPFQTMSKHGDIGSDFRSMFIPDPGNVFINCDQSQAEARIVALLSEDYELLQLFDLIDIHRFTAAIYLDLPIINKVKNTAKALELVDEVREALKDITEDQRFTAKFIRHGGNYDMGKHVFMLTINTAAKRFNIPVQISEYKAAIMLAKFHAFSPKIRNVFHRQIQECLTSARTLIRPDGSKRRFFDRIGPELFKQGYADIPQHTVAHQTKRAGLELQKMGIRVVLESHDALLVEHPAHEAEKVAKLMKELMSRPIDFSQCSLKRGTLVIPAEVEIGENYAEMKKFKC